MSLSRKREGEEMSSEPAPKHGAPADANQTSQNVIIVVDGNKFRSTKEDLADHSKYFEHMFFTNFEEKNKKEVELKNVHPDGFKFQLFLDVIDGIDTITDDNVQDALVVAGFLESATLEKKRLDHLTEKSTFTMVEQIELAKVLKSNNLMEQIFLNIKTPAALDIAVPQDYNELTDNLKNIVMQKSLELLGFRKPQPPKIEEPMEIFEKMVEQMQQQADFVNQEGKALAEQGDLLYLHYYIEMRSEGKAEVCDAIAGDPMILALMKDWQRAEKVSEQNYLQAQIQVLKLKHLCQNNNDLPLISWKFKRVAPIIARCTGNEFRRYDIYSGDRQVDREFNEVIADFRAKQQHVENARLVANARANRQRIVNGRPIRDLHVNEHIVGRIRPLWLERIGDYENLMFMAQFDERELRAKLDNVLRGKIDTIINDVRYNFYNIPGFEQPRQN